MYQLRGAEKGRRLVEIGGRYKARMRRSTIWSRNNKEKWWLGVQSVTVTALLLRGGQQRGI